jgi:hypothetical protein
MLIVNRLEGWGFCNMSNMEGRSDQWGDGDAGELNENFWEN